MDHNVRQVVPFFTVANMERSVRFYVDDLGFAIKYRWDVNDQLRWCWITLGGASVMLQEGVIHGDPSTGVAIYFICEDALAIYRDLISRSVPASEPEVLNSLWVTSMQDPDGYNIHFESPTDIPEHTKLSDLPSTSGSAA